MILHDKWLSNFSKFLWICYLFFLLRRFHSTFYCLWNSVNGFFSLFRRLRYCFLRRLLFYRSLFSFWRRLLLDCRFLLRRSYLRYLALFLLFCYWLLYLLVWIWGLWAFVYYFRFLLLSDRCWDCFFLLIRLDTILLDLWFLAWINWSTFCLNLLFFLLFFFYFLGGLCFCYNWLLFQFRHWFIGSLLRFCLPWPSCLLFFIALGALFCGLCFTFLFCWLFSWLLLVLYCYQLLSRLRLGFFFYWWFCGLRLSFFLYWLFYRLCLFFLLLFCRPRFALLLNLLLNCFWLFFLFNFLSDAKSKLVL